jgi:CRP-like cAMP-binding protein
VADLAGELAQLYLFADLPAQALQSLARVARVRTVRRGQILFTAEDPSDYLYLIRSGRVRVVVRSPRGDELVLNVLGPGDSLGELSMVDGQPRSAGAEAVEDCQLIALPAREVRALLDSDPAALRAVALALAAAMRRLSGTAADLVFLDLPRRLAKLILADAKPRRDGTAESALAMSQAGVAAQLGVTRQSLNRALAALAQRGWITVDGQRVTIHDLDALIRYADLDQPQ